MHFTRNIYVEVETKSIDSFLKIIVKDFLQKVYNLKKRDDNLQYSPVNRVTISTIKNDKDNRLV